jgi:hypothetical protein
MDPGQLITLDEPLVMTSNNLVDIITWLKRGAYVIIYTDSWGRFFHNCDGHITPEQAQAYIQTHRFIYVNVSSLPGLLDDGEWNWYIINAGISECHCQINNIADDPSNIPHKNAVQLRF